jgi:Txe/YoeB family toxin of Txe-Axe toxin-antitoxin module
VEIRIKMNTTNGWEDYSSWADDRKTPRGINRLIEEARRVSSRSGPD